MKIHSPKPCYCGKGGSVAQWHFDPTKQEKLQGPKKIDTQSGLDFRHTPMDRIATELHEYK